MSEQPGPEPTGDLRKQICELLTELAGDPSVTAQESTSIADLNLDSMALSYVFAFVERQHGVQFDNDELDADRYGSVAALCDRVEAKVAGARS